MIPMRSLTSALAALAVSVGMQPASADSLPEPTIAELCLECDTVVEVEIVGPRRLRVPDGQWPEGWKRSRWFRLTPEREITLSGPPLTDLDRVVESAYVPEGEDGERIDSNRAVIFLNWRVNPKTGCGHWRVADQYLGGTAGIFLLENGSKRSACYGYVQFTNPGGYVLVAGDRQDTDRVPSNVGELREAVARGSRLAARFESARKKDRLEDRVAAFAEFLTPKSDHHVFYRAIRELERLGPPAAERMLAAAAVYERHGDQETAVGRRRDLLAAVGTVGDPATVPRLLELARQARERARLDVGADNSLADCREPISGREATPLKAAVRIDDPRAMAACREALVRSAVCGRADQIEYYLNPLAAHPSKANIPALETALAELPPGTVDPYLKRNYHEEARQDIRKVLDRHRLLATPVEAQRPPRKSG